MVFATLVAVPALGRVGWERFVRVAFLANAAVTPMIATVYFFPNYSYGLLLLGFPWALTASLSMLLLALMLRKGRGGWRAKDFGVFGCPIWMGVLLTNSIVSGLGSARYRERPH